MRKPKLIPVPCIDRHQFEILQQRARIHHEFNMSTPWTRQNRVSRTGRQVRTHQLIPLQVLLASEAAHGFAVGIGRESRRRLDGWFHKFLEKETWSPARGACSTLCASSVPRQQSAASGGNQQVPEKKTASPLAG